MRKHETPMGPFTRSTIFRGRSSLAPARNKRGFSAVELVIVLAIMMTMMAISAGPLIRSYRNYRLSNVASEVANILQRTRYEAIRRNTPIACRWQDPTKTLFIDVNKNNTIDPGERILLLPQDMDILGSGSVPGASSMGYANLPQVPPLGTGMVATVDARGTVSYGAAAPVVYVIYLGYPGNSGSGFRAVTLTPTGQTKVWSANNGGAWHSP